jgi:hypothetical protein
VTNIHRRRPSKQARAKKPTALSASDAAHRKEMLQLLDEIVFCTRSKIPKNGGRGMAQTSLDLIEAMRQIAEAAQPITGRGVGYSCSSPT